MTTDYLRCLREEIFNWNTYSASPSDFPIKLDAMESPYVLEPAMRAMWLKKLAACDINRYPNSRPPMLHKQIAEHAGISDSCDLLFGNGSDELIQLIMLALAKPDSCVLSPQPSFSVYAMVAAITRLQYIPVPLNNDDFSLDEAAFLAMIQSRHPALICLAQPNNPTGNLWSADTIEAIIQSTSGYVLIDEAYVSFSSRHFMRLLDKYENVLVMRTFSKIGFAGLRFGFLTGRREIIAQLNKLRLPYNTGVLVHCGIEFALENFEYFQQKLDEIRDLRDVLFNDLQDLPSLKAFPSETNFILFRLPAGTADTVFNSLKQTGILIKNVSSEPGLNDCLRVTVGTADENQQFIQALKAIVH